MLFDRISTNKDIMYGKPCIKGTRITVEFILRKSSEGATFAELLLDYPGLLIEDLQQVFKYSAHVILNKEVEDKIEKHKTITKEHKPQ